MCKRRLLLFGVLGFLHLQGFSQSEEGSIEETILNQEIAQGNVLNLTQLGNQNTADITQFSTFGQEVALRQDGTGNYSNIFFYGSGIIQSEQMGTGHNFDAYLSGENKYLEVSQSGSDHDITLWSVGDNSSYQFIQSGNQNFIEYINQTGNDLGIIIMQRGNNMNISIRSN